MSKAELLKLLEEYPEDTKLFWNVLGLSIYRGEKFLGLVDFTDKKLVLVESK